jgi:hypothetical protein
MNKGMKKLEFFLYFKKNNIHSIMKKCPIVSGEA